jgi:hypothetical protein
MDMELLLMK